MSDGVNPFTQSANALSSMAGPRSTTSDGGVLGRWMTSTGQTTKGWKDLFSPIPASATPEQREAAKEKKAAQAVRQVASTLGAIASLINAPKDMLDTGFANLTAPLAAVFPSMPAATLTTLYVGTPHAHLHPPSLIPPAPPVPLPSLGPVMLGTFLRVLINGLPAARVKDIGIAFTCGGFFPFFQITLGSSNVFIGGHRAARMGDLCKACTEAENRDPSEAGAFLAKIGKMAGMALKGIHYLGLAAGVAGAAADLAEAAVEDQAAMASAKALAAAMGAAQMAADLAAAALTKMMGKDPGEPPSIGALMMGHPNVLIGGFPMFDIPNPATELLGCLSKFTARSPQPENEDEEEPCDGNCE